MPRLMISLESLSMLDSTYPTTKVQMQSGLSGTGTSEDILMSTLEPITSLLEAILAIAPLAIRTLLVVTSLAGSSAVETLLVEQVVVYSTLPQEYSTLTFRGEVVADNGGVEEKSKVIYWHRTNTVIYYMYHNGHSCIA